MSNSFKIPADVEQRIRQRDMLCVYCHKVMIYPYRHDRHSDSPTIEHLREEEPFYWDKGLKEEDLAICCGSCNSSRRRKKLIDWFKTTYCTDEERNINENTVAKPVREYLQRISVMKITYDKGVDALNVTLRTGSVVKTVAVAHEVMLDLDKRGNVLHVEVIEAGAKL